MKNFKNINILILIGLIIIGFVFYWFQIRPAKIHSYCIKENSYLDTSAIDGTPFNGGYDKVNYIKCLHENGL